MNRNNSNSPNHPHQAEADSRSLFGEMMTHLRVSIIATIVLGVIISGVYPLIVWGLAQLMFPHQANGSLVKKDGTLTNDDSQAVGSALLGQPFMDAGYFHARPSAAQSSPANPGSGNNYDPTSSGGTNYGPLSDKLINGLVQTPTPPATQPAATLQYDGVRLRTIHYAVDNNISFKLYNCVYHENDDNTYALERKDEVQLKNYLNDDGTLNDVKLVNDFPHPTSNDEYSRTVLIAADFALSIPADAVTASSSGLDPHISPANAKLQTSRVAKARNIKPEQVDVLIAEHTDQPSLGFLGDPGVNVVMLNLALDAKYPAPAATPTPAAPTTTPATAPAPTATTIPVH